MGKYIYTTDQFGLSEEGIHLLRSNFNFETIPYSSLTSLEIGQGKLIKNWLWILLIGSGLIIFSIYYTKGVIDLYNDPSVHALYIESIVVPILPFFFGIFCIYNSLRNGTVMTLQHNSKKTSYDLTGLAKNKELSSFIAYLKSNRLLHTKLKLSITENTYQ